MECTQEEIYKTWIAYRETKEESLRNHLITKYLPLVKYTAERLHSRLPQEVDLEDLIHAGIFGLIDAIEAYDLSRGVKFETYCIPRIRGAILDELRALDWVPRMVRLRAHKLQRAFTELQRKLGRVPSEEELAEALEMTMDEYSDLVRETTTGIFISLDRKWYETDNNKEVREVDLLDDERQEEPTSVLQREDIKRLVVRGLSQKERLIILLYYYEELTMKEIGLILDISESRVSQMHASILARLKNLLRRRRSEFAV